MSVSVIAVCTKEPSPTVLSALEDVPDVKVSWLVVQPESPTAPIRLHQGARPPRGISPIATDPVRVIPLLEPEVARFTDPTVLVPLDGAAIVALHRIRKDFPQVLLMDTPEHALAAARLIAAGRSVPSIIAPLPANAVSSESPTVEFDEDSCERPWLTPQRDVVAVNGGELSPFARAVVRERSHIEIHHPGKERGRLLVAPTNYAGQSWAWAQAVRHHVPGWDARNLTVVSDRARFVFESDVMTRASSFPDPITRLDLALGEVQPATHVLLEAMRPVLGALAPDTASDDVRAGAHDARALVASGRPTALLFHGTEVRRPAVHMAGPGWTPFAYGDADPWTEHLTRVTDTVHAALAELDLPRFVSTLDLLDYVPEATWLPISLLPGDFSPAEPPLQGKRPVVLHLPSASRLKGTEHVDTTMRELADRGLIEYRRPGAVPPALVPQILREADIVVDQIVLGNPGVLAAQALAAGRLVIAHLPTHVRSRFPMAPPVLEATPLTLRTAMLDVIADPDTARGIAALGPDFARELHDGRLSAKVLRESFLEPHAEGAL